MENGLIILEDDNPAYWAYRMIRSFQFLRDFKIMQKAGGLDDQDNVYLAAMEYLQNLIPEKTLDGNS